MSDRSGSHLEAYGELSRDEKAALGVLEDLYAEAGEDGKAAVNKVEALILQ